jgi:selenocysteine lyase/cysteine desulfurase
MEIADSRRSFLIRVATGSSLLPAVPSLARSLSSSTDSRDSEAYWELVRRQFAFREEKVPLNAANLCPSPRVVAERVSELTHDIDVDCSFNNRAKFYELREEARRRVAEHLGVTDDEIALVRNTSEANNIINNGLPLKAGDEIILWDQNHPTNNVAWDVRAARFGYLVKRVSTPPAPESPGELLKVFEEAFTSRTRVLAITHVSNVSGVRLPVKALSESARRRGIYVHLDGAQTLGALHFNLKELGCDSYSASAHKWLCGPKEAGILYVSSERIAEIWPNVVAPGWGNDADPDVKGARKFESMGQRDDACLAAMGTIIDFHRMIGPERVEARMMELAAALKEGLKEAGFRLVTPLDASMSGGVVIIDVPQAARGKVLDRLYQEHGIAGSASGGLRLCPHLYNTREHVERALRGVRALRELIV